MTSLDPRSAARLVKVVQELSLARSLEAIQVLVRSAARELTGADGATFVLRDGDLCHYADEDAIAPLWKGQRFPMSACISGWVMLNRTPAVLGDIYADPRIPADAYRPTFVKSLAMVPIRASDPIAAIGNYWATPHVATDDEVHLLQALADSVSVAMENVRLVGELEARLRERTAALEVARRAEASARFELDERRRAEESLRRTEEQLRQSQKMEAIGLLASGIAHDFNNVLSVILSYSQLLLGDMKPTDPIRGDLEEIQEAGQRAATLTRQLLAFGRRQALELRVLNANDVITGIDKMVRRLVGADIELEVRAAPALGPVLADAGQLEQVLVNLIVNARDAMPRGGKLTLETANMELSGEYTAAHLGVAQGDYVMLAVSDTGIGMDKETQARIFEPFFTTKERGKGTGLGLSTVYGIVKQCGGHIWVYSEVGRGTTFKIYLPRHAAAVAPGERHLPAVTRLTGSETILLVDDDDQVRAAAAGILRRNGYNVLVMRNAGEALLTCEQHPQTIHLLLTDVVMPQMSGVQLARRLSATRPEMKIVCMSGYTDEAVVRHGVIDSELAFLQKPLTPERLLRKVRQELDAR